MAYQKLQVSGAIAVIPSDTVDIPNPSAVAVVSTTDGSALDKLIDSTVNFTTNGVKVGDIIYSGVIAATVTAIDSATQLSIAPTATIASSAAYTIYSQADNPSGGCVLYCGATGNINVLTAAGQTVTFTAVPTGAFMPVQVKRVNAASPAETTATDIIALF